MSFVALQKLPYAQAQRLHFIESMVMWEGSVQRQRVSDVFRVSPNHITRDIHLYLKEFPRNLEYDVTVRAYRPGEKFKPAIASGRPEEYLALLQAYTQSGSTAVLPALGSVGLSVNVLPGPPCSYDRDVLSGVIQAVRAGRGLKISYHSLGQEKPVRRAVWPHALVSTGDRWHIRAYDDLRREFRDFVLQRIGHAELVPIASPINADADEAWHLKETLQVIPNPKLTELHRKLVAREYGMKKDGNGWVWQEELRSCLIGYFAQRYRLDIRADTKPMSRLALRDRERLKKYFFSQDVTYAV